MKNLTQFRKEESELFDSETGKFYTGTIISPRQCELMRDAINELEGLNKELAETIMSAMRIKSLWVPPEDYHGDEHNGEFIALSSMEEMFEKVLTKYKLS